MPERLRSRCARAGLTGVLALAPVVAAAGQEPGSPPRPLVVAIHQAPPFAMRDGDGWRGLSVELWDALAKELDLTFEWRELSTPAIEAGLATGDVDAAPVGLSVTAERLSRFDFSQPYLAGGLTLAYRAGDVNPWLATLRSFFSLEFLGVLTSLAVVLLVAGFAVWSFERRRNAAQFGDGDVIRGLADGFWWSAVTMTTVGYGDKAPKTLGGRAVALLWMLLSIVIIAGFTGSIAASLTTENLAGQLLRDRPVNELRVGVLEGSSADALATDRGARVARFTAAADAAAALREGEVDVILHDEPVLRYFAKTRASWLEVAPTPLVRETYAIGLPDDSPLRARLNRALLELARHPAWERARRAWVGEESGG